MRTQFCVMLQKSVCVLVQYVISSLPRDTLFVEIEYTTYLPCRVKNSDLTYSCLDILSLVNVPQN